MIKLKELTEKVIFVQKATFKHVGDTFTLESQCESSVKLLKTIKLTVKHENRQPSNKNRIFLPSTIILSCNRLKVNLNSRQPSRVTPR